MVKTFNGLEKEKKTPHKYTQLKNLPSLRIKGFLSGIQCNSLPPPNTLFFVTQTLITLVQILTSIGKIELGCHFKAQIDKLYKLNI